MTHSFLVSPVVPSIVFGEINKMPADPKWNRVFCDYNIYCNDETLSEFWHWSDTSEGLMTAHFRDSVNILVNYNPNADPNFGT